MGLLILRVGHPSEMIRKLSQQLDVAMAKSIGSSMEFLSSLALEDRVAAGQIGLAWEGTARRDYAEAHRHVNELAEAIRKT